MDKKLTINGGIKITAATNEKAGRKPPPLTHRLLGVAEQEPQIEDMAADDPRVQRAMRAAVADAARVLPGSAR